MDDAGQEALEAESAGERADQWVASAGDWAGANEVLLWWLFALSLLVFFGSLIAVPWIVVRLPQDYFAHERRIEWRHPNRHPTVQVGLIFMKNLAGLVLLVAGVAMLVLPGQGLLTIFMGLVLIDFPGKYRLQRYLVSRPAVLRSLNWLRQRRGRKPLVLDA